MTLRKLTLAGTLIAAAASMAHAHGGSYQPPPPPMPPGGGVPPIPPKPGPTTPSGGPGGKAPSTPSGNPGPGGPTTPGGGVGGPTTPPRPSGPRVGGLSDAHWTRWWYPNRMHLLDWHTRAGEQAADVTPSGTASGAADALWRAEAQRILAAFLDHKNEDIASGAAIALGKSGDASHASALVRVMEDDGRQQSVREAAALALGLLRTDDVAAKDARKSLEKLALARREPERLRAMAVYAMGLRREQGSLPMLLDMANSGGSRWDVPAAAVTALGLSGFDIVQPDLQEILQGPRRRRNQETVRRTYAAQALALMSVPDSLAALRKAATDSDEEVRRGAMLALGAVATSDDAETAEVLVRAIHRDRNSGVRHMAAVALGRLGHDRAEAALRHAYLKGDRQLQPFAAIGLGLLARHPGNERVARLVVRDLETRANADLRGALAIAVGLSRDATGAPILRELATDRGDPNLRGHAALALGLLGDRQGSAPILRDLLAKAKAPDVQREAALALGMLGDVEAVRILTGLLEDGGSVYVRGSAAVALGRIGGSEGGQALLALLQDKKSPDLARAMAAVGLGLILDPSEGQRLAAAGAELNWYLFTPTVQEILTIL